MKFPHHTDHPEGSMPTIAGIRQESMARLYQQKCEEVRPRSAWMVVSHIHEPNEFLERHAWYNKLAADTYRASILIQLEYPPDSKSIEVVEISLQ